MWNTKMLLFYVRAGSVKGSALPRDFQAVLVGAGRCLFKGTAPRNFYFRNQSLTKALGDY